MNILLISPNTLTVPYPVYPISLDYVAGAVAKRHRVSIADLNIIDRPGLERLLLEFAPEIIGLSCRNIDNTEAGDPLAFVASYRDLIRWLKKRTTAPIVCGGSGFTIMPEAVFAALDADYGIIGEGERFGPFIEALADGRDVTALPGILTRERPFAQPAPWQGEQPRLFGDAHDHHLFYVKHGGMLNLQTKRGCAFHCVYCPYPHIEGNRHRLQPPETVARTALRLQEAGARYLFMTDSAFNGDVRHSMTVAQAFIDYGLNIPWGGFFAPTRLPDDYFPLLKTAGLKHVEFGTESLASPVLRAYRKPFLVDDVFAAHRQAHAAGLHVAHYFLLGGPGETLQTIDTTLTRIEQLEKTALFFFIGMRIYPNTPLYDIAIAEQKITPATDLLEPIFYYAAGLDHQSILAPLEERANGRSNWVVGSGGAVIAETIRKLHERNRTGPLWEFIVR